MRVRFVVAFLLCCHTRSRQQVVEKREADLKSRIEKEKKLAEARAKGGKKVTEVCTRRLVYLLRSRAPPRPFTHPPLPPLSDPRSGLGCTGRTRIHDELRGIE